MCCASITIYDDTPHSERLCVGHVCFTEEAGAEGGRTLQETAQRRAKQLAKKAGVETK